MAKKERHIDASPETVFSVLSDPFSYGYWVVGSEKIRDADDGWPAPGTRFHHTVGLGPFKVDDHTVSEWMESPVLLELRAKARPLGTAKVRLELEPEGTARAFGCSRTPAICSPRSCSTRSPICS